MSPDVLHSTLSRGKSLEQFLGGQSRDSARFIRWIEIRPENGRLEIWNFTVPDLGDVACVDLYEFIGDDEGQLFATSDSSVEAIELAGRRLGALSDRWVNQFVVQEEYRDFIRAGRPDRWSGVVA